MLPSDLEQSIVYTSGNRPNVEVKTLTIIIIIIILNNHSFILQYNISWIQVQTGTCIFILTGLTNDDNIFLSPLNDPISSSALFTKSSIVATLSLTMVTKACKMKNKIFQYRYTKLCFKSEQNQYCEIIHFCMVQFSWF